jgi:hypothetical protein
VKNIVVAILVGCCLVCMGGCGGGGGGGASPGEEFPPEGAAANSPGSLTVVPEDGAGSALLESTGQTTEIEGVPYVSQFFDLTIGGTTVHFNDVNKTRNCGLACYMMVRSFIYNTPTEPRGEQIRDLIDWFSPTHSRSCRFPGSVPSESPSRKRR